MTYFYFPLLITGQRVAVGSGHILNDLCASLWFSYLLLYFENVVGMSSDYSAYLMLLGQVSQIFHFSNLNNLKSFFSDSME